MLTTNKLTTIKTRDNEEVQVATNVVKTVTLQETAKTAEWMIVVAKETTATMPVTSADRQVTTRESAQMVLNSREVEIVTSVINQVIWLVSVRIKMVKMKAEVTNGKEETMVVPSRELMMVKTVEILRVGIMIRQTTVVPREMMAGTTESVSAEGCKN